MADCFDDLDGDSNCRAIVLCSNGKHFCAGANFATADQTAEGDVLAAESADQGILYIRKQLDCLVTRNQLSRRCRVLRLEGELGSGHDG